MSCLFTLQIRPFYATQLTMICCCQVQNYIYWIISTENDHRHHHKFIKYEKRSRKDGNMLGLPIKQNLCHFSVSLNAQHFLQFVPTVQLIPYIYPAFVPFGSYCTSIPLYLWIRQSMLSSTCWHILFHMLFIVSKQCTCSRRVHIEGHMNRVGLNWMLVILDNNSDNDSFGSFLSKKEHKSYLLQHNCLMIA